VILSQGDRSSIWPRQGGRFAPPRCARLRSWLGQINQRNGYRAASTPCRPLRRSAQTMSSRTIALNSDRLAHDFTIYRQPAIVIPRSSAHRSGVSKMIRTAQCSSCSLASRPRGSFRCAVAAPWTRNFLPSWACLLGGWQHRNRLHL
jgi:hypothetical protein